MTKLQWDSILGKEVVQSSAFKKIANEGSEGTVLGSFKRLTQSFEGNSGGRRGAIDYCGGEGDGRRGAPESPGDLERAA